MEFNPSPLRLAPSAACTKERITTESAPGETRIREVTSLLVNGSTV